MVFKKYEFFLEIAKYGSVTKAAEHMMISQSALSKYLRRLEEELGTQLFDRSALPLKLTRAGEIFLRYVTQCMAMEKLCVQQIDQLQDNLVETLKIGFGSWRSSCILPQVLPLFRSKCPFVKIELTEAASDITAEAVSKGQLDLCILGAGEHYPLLERVPLKDELIFLVGNSSNPFVKLMKLTEPGNTGYIHVNIHDLAQESFVMASKKQNFARFIHTYFEKNNFNPLDVTYIENLHTNMYMVAYGDYFSFLPELALHTLRLPENLSFFTFGDPPLTFPISLGYSPSRPLSKSAKLFINIVQQFYGKVFSG